ncbi:unnamed protein product [Rhizoctonia solani]|uniref:DEAD-box RNA helicase Q domain-containing protein n=1 Tax=Rhizoctonia solani TaxID=456999 RepID=A0A8H3B4A2_9AGAM|nr:unnamed protein product [Rhizoctonia solani]
MEDIGIRSDEKLLFKCSKGVKVMSAFDEIRLIGDLLHGIYAYNFEKPTAVQQHSFLSITKGHNIIVQAPSGTVTNQGAENSTQNACYCQVLSSGLTGSIMVFSA